MTGDLIEDSLAETDVPNGTEDEQSGPALAGARLKAVLMSWAAMVVIGAIIVGWLSWSTHRTDQRAAAGDAALARARSGVAALLSYDGATILDQLDDESRLLTGPFRRKYLTLVRSVVGPAAQQQRIVTKATVVSSAVMDAGSQRVKTLLFVNLVTTGGTGGTPAVTGSRLVVVLKHVGDKWLISSLDPV